MFEHTITFSEVSYFIEDKDIVTDGNAPLYGDAMPFNPDPASFLLNDEAMEKIAQMGNDGWELVNAVPLLRGCYNEGAHYGYSLTAGYFLFWKRKKE